MSVAPPTVISCELLVLEVRRALRKLGRADTPMVTIPSACHLGTCATARPAAVVHAARTRDGPTVGVCLSCVRPPRPGAKGEGEGKGKERMEVLTVQAQAELVLGADAAAHALDQGDFLVLPAWLARWETIVREDWGFDQPSAAAFFAQTTGRLLVLDTGARPIDPAQVQAMARFVERPFEIRFVGTSHLELLLDRALSKAEHDAAQSTLQQALGRSRERAAEQASVADYLNTLGQLLEEEEVVAQLERTAAALFDARQVRVEARHDRARDDSEGFVQPVVYRDQHLADLVVKGVAHPEAVPRYRPLARALCDASAIALHAARLFRKEQAASQALAVRVEELDAFISMAAHDLRGPLATILGYSELVTEVHADDLPADAAHLMTRIGGVAMGMSELIDDLLTLARIGRQAVERQDVDLEALVAALGRDLAARSPDSAAQVVLEGPLPVLHTSPAWAREVFENLISNAIRYNDQLVPRVEISAWTDATALTNTHGVKLAGVTVRDNGRGIPAAELERAFTLFTRLSSSRGREGTGIGLAIVQRIIEAEGGTIRLVSQPGQGTTVFLALPCQSHDDSRSDN